MFTKRIMMSAPPTSQSSQGAEGRWKNACSAASCPACQSMISFTTQSRDTGKHPAQSTCVYTWAAHYGSAARRQFSLSDYAFGLDTASNENSNRFAVVGFIEIGRASCRERV